jgi:hypothetical protein
MAAPRREAAGEGAGRDPVMLDVCPSGETLERLLGDDLAVEEAAALRAHLESCDGCRAVLDWLSDDAELRGWADTATPEPAIGPGLARLMAIREPSTLQQAVAALAVDVESLGFLEPPEREGDLGRLGRYAVEAVLGRGGMGIVLRARDEDLQRPVALKVLRPELAHEQARARFVREARAAARVGHDHIVGVHAVANAPTGLPYLVMELIAGRSLAEAIRAEGRLAPQVAADLVRQAAEGLAAAHAAGLVHRDVKPANIMLDGATGRAKVMDFGLARLTELASEMTREGTSPGTPAYMSPEQARGADELDPRSDVYGLGVTLYEALTGEVPFRGAPHMVLRQVIEEEPRPPRRLNDAIPRDLETICLEAMAKEPSRRYPTARALADDLGRWQQGIPIRARPAGPFERLMSWTRRNRRVALLGTAVLSLLVVLAVGSTVAALVIDRARGKAVFLGRKADALAKSALAAQDLATERARIASEQRLLALDTTGMLVKEVQLQLGAAPGTIGLRQRLAEIALERLEKIARDPSGDADVLLARAVASNTLGDVAFLAGHSAESRARHEAARDLAERLSAAQPNAIEPKRQLALALDRLGDLAAYSADSKGAEKSYLRAQTVRESLPASYKEGPIGLRERAVSLQKLGDLKKWAGDLGAARKAFEAGLALTERATIGDRKLHLSDLRFSHARLGEVALFLQDTEGATREFRKALEYAEALAAADPGDPRGHRAVDSVRNQLANTLLRTGDAAEAVRLDRLALAGRQAAVQESPGNAEARRDLAVAYSLLGDALLVAEEFAAAAEEHGHCLAINEHLARDDPSSAQKHYDILFSSNKILDLYERLGRWDAAVQLAERARQEMVRMRELKVMKPEDAARFDAKYADHQAAWRVAEQALIDGGTIGSRPRGEARILWRIRALALARQGKHTDAAAAADRYRALAADEPEAPRNLARIHALCARAATSDPDLRRKYLDRAIDDLRRYAQASPDALLQEFDPDLAEVRDRPDVAALRASARRALTERRR